MKFRLLVIPLLLIFIPVAQASIALDVVSTSGTIGNVSTFSWNHTVSGANTILVCSLAWNSGFNAPTLTSVTYNSVALTTAFNINNATYSGRMWMGYLKAPTTGTNSVAITWSTTIGTAIGASGSCSSYTGVNQTTPIDSAGTSAQINTSGQSSVTLTVTTVANGAWIVTGLNDDNGNSAPTVATSQTQRSNQWVGTPASCATSDRFIATAGATTVTWSTDPVGDGGSTLEAFSIAPATATSATQPGAFLVGP